MISVCTIKENNMNIKQTLQLLDIQEVTTKRQKKNGTREFELPIKDSYTKKKIRVASFASGYVRNQNSASSNYQLNKTKKNFEKEWPNGYKYYSTERILIPNEQDRLEYLISYCLKNYYVGKANQVANGDYVPKWKYEHELKNRDAIADIVFPEKAQDIQVIVNGHRYKVK
jgi:hypothetical protein